MSSDVTTSLDAEHFSDVHGDTVIKDGAREGNSVVQFKIVSTTTYKHMTTAKHKKKNNI